MVERVSRDNPRRGTGGRGTAVVATVALLVLFSIGCSRSDSLPPTASIPRLVLPVTVQELESKQPETPVADSLEVSEEVLWSPQATPRDWKCIVLHHTATGTGSVESIHDAHAKKRDGRGNPWLGIGYHFVIGNGQGMSDGEVEPTFRWRGQLQGAHAGDSEHNQSGIGIVLVGNFEKHAPTPAQQQSVHRLVRHLSHTFGIEPAQVIGHGDIKATACPGRYFSLDALRAGVASLDDSGGSPLARFVPEIGIPRKEALRR